MDSKQNLFLIQIYQLLNHLIDCYTNRYQDIVSKHKWRNFLSNINFLFDACSQLKMRQVRALTLTSLLMPFGQKYIKHFL